ncbi:response regulator transcription factor [Vagococcus elongatus]|uniref:DNA-binding response regulator n=1 Tax=Vagococcus elongatus TaxID=180344 RepID=A0A430B1Z9_9ENTE|nr:response regulator transcription factor [Vagococcus elongatus]RSU14355.1 DNA-binding response regulator [Vagococcus elongatus]
MKKILILEDDQELNDGIKLALSNEEYQFFQCRKITEAKKIITDEAIDLILLDLNLPDGHGLVFLKEVRSSSTVPIIIITANNMESDIIIGLESGANDYITKPFSLMILRARVAVQLRQTVPVTKIQIENMTFDFQQMIFVVNGVSVELSKTEQKLLYLLVNNRGATLKREFLIDNIWSGNTDFVDDHALTVTVKRLRKKIDDNPNQPKYIRTVYGLGYSWM